MKPSASVDGSRLILLTLNQLFDMERKLIANGDVSGVGRNVERIKNAFEEQEFFYEDPMGQPYSETRNDLEASIAGTATDGLTVVEVIKPIIRHGPRAYSVVVQKGIVVVTGAPVGNNQSEGENA